MERSRREYCDYWSWLFNFCANPDHNFGDIEKPPHEEELFLSYHDEPVSDAFLVQLAVYHRRPVEQECDSLWNYRTDVALFVLDNKLLVLRVHLHHLRLNYQWMSKIEDEIHSIDGLRRTGYLCDGIISNFLWVYSGLIIFHFSFPMQPRRTASSTRNIASCPFKRTWSSTFSYRFSFSSCQRQHSEQFVWSTSRTRIGTFCVEVSTRRATQLRMGLFWITDRTSISLSVIRRSLRRIIWKHQRSQISSNAVKIRFESTKFNVQLSPICFSFSTKKTISSQKRIFMTPSLTWVSYPSLIFRTRRQQTARTTITQTSKMLRNLLCFSSQCLLSRGSLVCLL